MNKQGQGVIYKGGEGPRAGGSLIIGSNPQFSPINHHNRAKMEELFPGRAINRYSSEEELRRPQYRPAMITSDIPPRREEGTRKDDPMRRDIAANPFPILTHPHKGFPK